MRALFLQMARMFGAPIDEGAADQIMGKLDQLKVTKPPTLMCYTLHCSVQ